MDGCTCPMKTPYAPTLAETCGAATLFTFMSLIEAHLLTDCGIVDSCGRATSRFRSEPDDEYDFIVVGGGSAGSVVASRLSENPNWKVLVIEAGDDEPSSSQVPSMMLRYLGTELDWNYETQKEKNACLNNGGICKWPRGKVLGGTSVMNGMMYMRGDPKDYLEWEKLGAENWNFDSVLPIFLHTEDNLQIDLLDKKYHATGGMMPITQFPTHPKISESIMEAGQELGFYVQDLNGANNTGFMIAQTMSKNGIRYSTARAYLRPARNRENLHILLKTTASRVLIDPAAKSVTGVEIIDPVTGKRREIRASKEVVVSCGAVASPQLLLLSGIGPKKDLEKVGVKPIHDLPGVGKNLLNHVSYTLKYDVDDLDTPLLNFQSLIDYLQSRTGLLSGTGLSQTTAIFGSPYQPVPGTVDTQLYFGGYWAECTADASLHATQYNKTRRISISPTVLKTKSRGYLKLASNDPLQPPLIVPNYLTEEDDIKILINGIRFANKLSQTKALQKWGMKLDRTPVKGCEKLTFDTDEYWKCAIMRDTAPENHQAGSCKMGNDENAVVDSKLKVRGIKGLRVIDASIMPTLTSGNVMGPIILIAEKGALMIKEDWA